MHSQKLLTDYLLVQTKVYSRSSRAWQDSKNVRVNSQKREEIAKSDL